MTIESIPLSALLPPSANPRTVFDSDLLDGLAASIKADGLLQNLVVTPVDGKKRRFRIVSGERRFRALKLLNERGDIGDTYRVSVEIRTDLSKDDILRLATIENLQREDLPPLDQAAALANLIRKGTTLDDLVARTGLSATTIRRRLALNTLCDEARTALGEKLLTLSQAEALTLGSAAAQYQLLMSIQHSPDDYSVSAIRDALLDEKPSAAIAIFPLERYTGTMTTDLFAQAESSYFDDAEQFLTLQRQAVDELAQEHAGKAAWVEVTESHRLPEWQYEKATKRQRKSAGVVINISPRGVVELREGLLKPEAIDRDTAEATADTPLAPEKRTAGYGAPLRRYIAWHKTLAVQEVLLAHPRKAKEVHAAYLLTGLWPHQALRNLPGESAPQAPFTAIDTHTMLVAKTLGFATGDDRGWDTLTADHLDEVEAYGLIKRLSDADLETLIVTLSVLPFGQDDCDRLDTDASLLNAVANDLEIDMRRHWQADEAFLSRRTRSQLADIARATGLSDGHSAVHAWKKTELVAGLLRHFAQAREAAAPNDAQKKALAWLPEAMQFPAVDPDSPPMAEAISDDNVAEDDDRAA